ncbi:hypothetical protein EDC04DRAFT_2902141 [Pisolithus marmoratus]|nr:hypothetical protein EDC04DRAFT_2902141 [Pisolithus marmoratus]
MSSVPYFPPDAVRAAIPGMWAANMKKLGAIMKEIPDASAEEDAVCRWLARFEEQSEQIEQIRKFAMDMSTNMPDYDEDTQIAIGAAFERLQAIQARFPPRTVKPKAKLTPVAPPASQSSSDPVRRSQRQARKVSVVEREGNERTPGAIEETQHAPTGDINAVVSGTSNANKPCGLCMRLGILCVREEGQACERCHQGKKKCNKAYKTGQKRKNQEGPPVSAALTSKRPKTVPAPPPIATTSSVSSSTHKPRPRVHLLLNPDEEASTPVSGSSAPPPPPPAPSAPLFFLSSTPNAPSQVPEPADIAEDPIKDAPAFSASPSGLLNDPEEVPVAVKSQEVEIDLTSPRETPNISPPPFEEEDAPPRLSRSNRRAWRRGRTALEELDAKIAKVEEAIEWNKESLSHLYLRISEVTAKVGTMGQSIQCTKQRLRLLKKWQEKYLVEGS